MACNKELTLSNKNTQPPPQTKPPVQKPFNLSPPRDEKHNSVTYPQTSYLI